LIVWVAAAPGQPLEEPAALDSLLQSGRLLQAAGRHEESRRYFERLLQTATGMGPLSHSVALVWLASAHYEVGRLTEARRALLDSIELRERTWGIRNQSDPHHARILTSLGGLELAVRRYAQAEDWLLRAMAIWERAPDRENDADFVMCLNNLAILDYVRNRDTQAARRLRQVVASWQVSLPPNDRRLVRAQSNLAGVLSRLGRHEEADQFSSEALAAFSQDLAREPIVAVELLSIRRSILRRGKRKREAKVVEAQLREFLQRTDLPHRIDISLLGAR
jgi:tetratricopeptide (TPR) repeat protein